MSAHSVAPETAEVTWVGFDDLSALAQTAIRHWDNEATAEEMEETAEAARAFEWQELIVPVQSLIERIMGHGDSAAYYQTWQAYHEWYLSDEHVPDHGESRWPVIEGFTGETAAGAMTLDDGWHRFHSYVRDGDTHVPMLRRRLRD